ncbi:MAG: RNase adapter RapZ, partial [Deltaproteobacteria bacterium]
EEYPSIFADIKKSGYKMEILFFEAASHILLNRFSETRREHPLTIKGTIKEKILLEKNMLQPLKDMASTVIDSSACNVHQLKEIVQRKYLADGTGKRLVVNVCSFGYKYGIPQDADIILDVRFLRNPHFVMELRERNGLDGAIIVYVLSFDETKLFLTKLFALIEYLLPLYESEGKPHLSIAFGCTAGRHRSVVVANEVAQIVTKFGYINNTMHRDIGRE